MDRQTDVQRAMSGADHCEVEGDEAALWTDRQTDVQRAMSGADHCEVEGDEAALWTDRQTDRRTESNEWS